MFQGDDIKDLVQLLQKRRAYLYHACQFTDFQSYLRLGGIPSRALLESTKMPYTAFRSDANDRANNDWDKVFGNFSDFGSTFGGGHGAVPNIYGPILFKIQPVAFYEATDIAICLRSAGNPGFNREQGSLSTIEEINRLFQHPENAQWASNIKSRSALQREFSNSSASLPEFSCSVNSGMFPLSHVDLVRVDSYNIQGQPLSMFVEQAKRDNNQTFRVFQRDRCPSYTQDLFDVLVSRNNAPSLVELFQDESISEGLRNWAQRSAHLETYFQSFSSYLLNGTIRSLLAKKQN